MVAFLREGFNVVDMWINNLIIGGLKSPPYDGFKAIKQFKGKKY